MDDWIWIYGINSVRAALRSETFAVREIWVAPKRRSGKVYELQEEALSVGIPCCVRDVAAITSVTGGAVHQNVAASCRLPAYLGEQALLRLCDSGEAPVFLVLDRVTDPRNFGACLRLAQATGIDAVVVPADNTASLTPAAVKAASGAVGYVRIARVTNLVRVLDKMRQLGIWVTGAGAHSGDRYDRLDYRRPTAFVLGSEGEGLRRLTVRTCDSLAFIPMHGRTESLNVAATAAVLLYEMRRQRGL